MKKPPTRRPDAFRLYWYFASERQHIFERRFRSVHPWTSDRILRDYKFCNVFRAADRVSQFLVREVCYPRSEPQPEDLLFQIVMFRLFSNNSTWRYLVSSLGRAPVIDDLRSRSLANILDEAKRINGRLYTNAFILCANDAYSAGKKHLNHIELLRDMFIQNDLAGEVMDAPSLGAVYDRLHEFPLMGDFMSYQIAVDLNYSNVVNFSENDFVKPGPGALRGIRKAFRDLRGWTPEEIIMAMVEGQSEIFDEFNLEFNGLWGRPLHAIDCQGLFCELDKYCREAIPELSVERTQIKSRFKPTGENIAYFFPPKWGINERVEMETAKWRKKLLAAGS